MIAPTTLIERATLCDLVRPDDFRRSLARILAMTDAEREQYFKKLVRYHDILRESFGIETDQNYAAQVVLAALQHGLFEKSY